MRVAFDLRGAQAHGRFVQGGIARWIDGVAHALLQRDDVELLGIIDPELDLSESARALSCGGRLVTSSELYGVAVDVHHVTSPFQMKLHELLPVPLAESGAARVVTFYDAIPLDPALGYPANIQSWWRRRAEVVTRADLVMCLSRFAARDGCAWIGLDESRVRIVGTGVPTHAARGDLSARLLEEIDGPFVLYTGGAADERKNVARLITAFGRLPRDLRESHQLVIASWVPPDQQAKLEAAARDAQVEDRVVFTGWVDDDALATLLTHCETLVYPSLHEGFGYPVLEAMAAGVPALTSSGTACAELLGHRLAVFDPRDPDDMAAKLELVLRVPLLRASLAAYGIERARQFSWDDAAERCVAAYHEAAAVHHRGLRRTTPEPARDAVFAAASPALLGTVARAFLTTAEAATAFASVATTGLGHGRVHVGMDRLSWWSLTRGAPRHAGPLACLVDSPAWVPGVVLAFRLRPGVAVLWVLDPLLEDERALRDLCGAAGAIVVRDEFDAARIARVIGPSVRDSLHVIAPPLAWRAEIAGATDVTSLEIQIYGRGAARDAVRVARRLPLVCALRPATFGTFPPGTVEQAAQLTESLAAVGWPASVRLAGAYAAGDVEQAYEQRDGRLPPRLLLGGPPSFVDIVTLANSASVHVTFAADSRSATEALADLALIAGRPVVAPGGPGASHAGLRRLPAEYASADLAHALISVFASDGAGVAPDASREPSVVASTLVDLMESVCSVSRRHLPAVFSA